MDLYEIRPTSRNSAECQPIELWCSDERRLVFKPMLVENPNDPAACINGDFVYQRKRKRDQWEDISEIPLNKLRAGEGVRISLKAAEVLACARHLAGLYRFHASGRLPRRKVHLLRLDLADDEAETLDRLDLNRIVGLGRRAGVDIIGQLLDWLADQENAGPAVAELRRLGPEVSQRLSTAAGVATIQEALHEWKANLGNTSEEFWQQMLAGNAFVLSQAFSVPLIIIKSKPYLGGKDVSNTGGHFGDYLASNPTTRNALLIEIKTPATPLLRASRYRDDIYAPSEDLSGGASQVLNYRQNLISDPRLVKGFEEQVQVLSPQCMLLIGDTRQLTSEDHRRSFELARSTGRDVMIVTYDELFGRLEALIAMFASGSS